MSPARRERPFSGSAGCQDGSTALAARHPRHAFELRMSDAPILPHGLLDPARRLRTPVGRSDRVRGTGPLSLVIYSDFECPDCQAFHRAFNQVPEALREQISIA